MNGGSSYILNYAAIISVQLRVTWSDPCACFVVLLFAGPQLLLDQEAWLQWRIPMLNSEEYGIATLFGSGGQAITAIYFVGSALRARRYLSGSGTSGSVANKAAMQRLMGRVLTSGCLMLIMTIVYGGGLAVIFHPVGFKAVFMIISPISIANSLLQLASFAPPAGAPPGPVEEARLVVKRAVRSVVSKFKGGRGVPSHQFPQNQPAIVTAAAFPVQNYYSTAAGASA